MRELSGRFQDDTIELIEEQFDKGIGPNGIKLRPKKNPDGNKPLTRTGALKKSFREGRNGSGGFVVTSDKMDEYGKYHQRGRKTPWVISPKNGTHLRFEVGGHVVYAKKVTHPGYAARPIYPSKNLPKRYADKYTLTARRFFKEKGFKF
jgi:hypothetical protein